MVFGIANQLGLDRTKKERRLPVRMSRWQKTLILAVIFATTSYAEAAFDTFDDKTAFLNATGATDATGPLPALGLGTHGGISVGSVDFVIRRFAIIDWTTRLPDLEIGISLGVGGSGDESIDAVFAAPVFSAGFDFVEPEFDPNVNSGFVDSTFEVTLRNGVASVGSFTFNAPNDTAAFVGVWSDTAFDRLEIRENVGTDDNEFYGRFFTGGAALPEPSSFAVIAIGGLTMLRRQTG